ncbi:MAG: nickel-dependent lactate racemase, partial [Eubacteriales bacterium]|nr:nickel-dependent lactate racemase [Eubacteriales bacterium]
ITNNSSPDENCPADEIVEIERALSNPTGTQKLSRLVTPGEKVVIITSDITRPFPSWKVLPHIINELGKAGIKDPDITVVFAIGSHRKHTRDEQAHLVGEDIYRRIRCIDSDPDDTVMLGTTRSGTPVEISREVAEADRRICLGNIEFHYFAGYSGGIKAIMPGVSTRRAIQANHSAMVKEFAMAGELDRNPVRIDIEETSRFLSIDFILNVVLDEKKNILRAFAGHHILAHREGCSYLDTIYKIPIHEKADIVIASAGGYPKDINLYQAQKALDNASHAVKDGGVIILYASCREGPGEKAFERWMLEAEQPHELIARIKTGFELGGHKAAAIAMVLEKASIFLVSDLDCNYVRRFHLQPYKNINDAIEEAYRITKPDPDIIIMPAAGSTLPCQGI